MTLRLNNANINHATKLDTNGYRQAEVPLARSGPEVSLQLPSDTMYLILEAAP
jgi:hypothetical protein